MLFVKPSIRHLSQLEPQLIRRWYPNQVQKKEKKKKKQKKKKRGEKKDNKGIIYI